MLATPLLLTGCAATMRSPTYEVMPAVVPTVSPQLLDHYGQRPNERFQLPEVDLSEIEPQFLRKIVDYRGSEPPGTIIVDTSARFLFLVQENGSAIRYGVGVGREGLAWSGRAYVGRKGEWPRWTPTQAMIAREPEKMQNGLAEWGLGSTIRSAPAHSTFTAKVSTPFTASTARMSLGQLGLQSQVVASA